MYAVWNMNNAYEKTVEWNAKGVEALKAGDVTTAKDYFFEGLQSTRTLTGIPSSIPIHCSSSVLWKYQHILSGKIVKTVTLDAHDDAVAAHDDFFAIYNRALSFSAEVVGGLLVPKFYAHLMTGILIYNLGLSFHLEALQTGGTAKLDRAMEFYSMSKMCMVSELSLRTGFHNDLVALVIIPTLAHWFFGFKPKAKWLKTVLNSGILFFGIYVLILGYGLAAFVLIGLSALQLTRHWLPR